MYTSLPILDLGDDFYTPVKGGAFANPTLRYRNPLQAKFIGLNQISDVEWVNHFGKFQALAGNLKTPLAMKYHGHQFQHYNPDLGDGRGFVFAQFLKDGHLFELGTKGSGQTPYSRRGDGRLTLKGAIRELLATDYLKKQRVLTSHTFSIVETAEKLERHDEPSPTRSAVLFRLSRGHIRIGNFQRAHYLQRPENISILVDYSLKYFYPEFPPSSETKSKFELFFKAVTYRLADLCASYMVAGFVHGVLNTDNINVSGESFDYGPYRFLAYYDPHFTAAYFDQDGLYSFGRQPPSFLWNLHQLKIALNYAEPKADLSKLDSEFALAFNVFFSARFLRKLNLKPKASADESERAEAFLGLAPNYYDDSNFPILDLKSIFISNFEDFSKAQFFRNTQSVIESFFQDLYKNQSKDFETAFRQILHWTQYDSPPSYFSDSTLRLFTQSCETKSKLTTRQAKIRNQSLTIDEVESVWNEIDTNENWACLYERITPALD